MKADLEHNETSVWAMGENRVYLRGDLIVAEVVGDQTAETTTAFGVGITKLGNELRGQGKRSLVLNFVTSMGRSTAESRKLVAHFSHTAPVDKFAIVGGSGSFKFYGQNLILRAVGMKNYRYFETEDKALFWLNEA